MNNPTFRGVLYNWGMNAKTIIVVLLVVALVVLAIIFWPTPSSAPGDGINGSDSTSEVNEPSASLGGQLYGAAKPSAAESVPETNPFKADVNPYTDAYQNPFAQ